MKAQQLKNAILQLAIQGKLVPQDPNDEPASVLFEKIQAEKEKLIAEGKIKKTKKTSDKCSLDVEVDFPFEIPNSWVWVRLSEITYNLGQKKPISEFNYIDVASIDNKKHILSNIINLVSADKAPSRARKIVQDGSILYSTVRPYLKNVCIFHNFFQYESIASTAFAVLDVYSNIFNKYLFYYLISSEFTDMVSKEMLGVAYPAINDEKLYKLCIAVPPLNEQKRIVAKIEELLPFIEEYDKKEQKLTTLNQQFPEQLKKSILQAAIQGQLVAQDLNDEPASELIKRIQAEKERLISEKKIKKPKVKSEIVVRDGLPYEIINGVERCIADELPFEIPESWCWVRLGDIGDWGAGSTPNRHEPKFYDNGTIPWLKTGDLNDGYITSIPEYITNFALEKNSLKINPTGSVLIAMYGATIGKLGILGIEATTNQACCACQVYKGVYNKYLFYYLMSQKKELQKRSEGSGQPNISREKIIKYLFPLPPIDEQKRIVQKIEEVFSHIESL
ncbi:MAG: restriction endonuclease subunit S [Haemophilus parainfluenzae]|nr:restriction endonuclease subunit S [Haemophilus parainfluenzae]